MSEYIVTADARQEQLRAIIREIDEGSDLGAVRKRFAAFLKNVTAEEIAAAEQGLINDGVPVSQIQKLCTIHAAVFEKSLERQRPGKAVAGHPVDTLRQENRALRSVLKEFEKALKDVARGLAAERARAALSRVAELDKHYLRKENNLFPLLERHHFAGPSKVMWGKHDEIRGLLKRVAAALNGTDPGSAVREGRELVSAAGKMIFLEEKILLPTALRKLTEQDWIEVRNKEEEIGFAWGVRPGALWDPHALPKTPPAGKRGAFEAKTSAAEGADAGAGVPPAVDSEGAKAVKLDVGSLSPEQINLMLKNLPFDLSFVDENDRVLYYSQTMERIFPRTPAVIGRAVQNCHPPKSVHVVNGIIESFRKKEKKAAEFWITMGGRFLLIRYFPMYDEAGNYKGTLEVSQDATGIRALDGEKRLLDA